MPSPPPAAGAALPLPDPPPGWEDLAFFRTGWPDIAAALRAEARPWQPAAPDLFRALALTPPDAVRVVILGQDPYPTAGRATGLAFSYPPGVRPAHSLANILRELHDDTGVARADGDLSGWARQGVLLLNTILSVPVGVTGGHRALGWQRLADQVLARVATRPTAFLLWGRPAQAVAAPHLDGPHKGEAGHLVLSTPHPSPLSARRGFFGARPFSRVNDWLRARAEAPIDWSA
ncbi:uracil-DNA glycosylase [Rhodobaculum claviforme]|uniref:Uracil-DNA glycosylase n=1 Tax=Rhodobaculum claviforme TaxID=1549854 RepID=A0A934TH90_9RHOB|nr:uracil-DNA glycosylase [Rhodobaculum claviforme]MBK5925824.1 uracil-DNA glycosylase [Rhodobaculum claviforme]